MLFFLFIIKIIYIKSYKTILIDKLFNKSETNTINLQHCDYYDEETFYYRGRPTDIKDIIDSNNINDINNYKYVYIPESKYLDNATLFPKSTVFFPLEGVIKYEYDYNKEYCFITIRFKIEQYKPFYYIVIGNILDNTTEGLAICILFTLCIFGLIYTFLLFIRNLKLIFFFHFYIYHLISFITSFFFLLGGLSFTINSALLSHLIYTFYKSFLFINLLFLIDGFRILSLENRCCSLLKTFLYFFLYNSIMTIILLYISYFLPSINNALLFIFKNIIEHSILLICVIKAIKKKFIPLYNQYQFEKIYKEPIFIVYKLKLLIYIKILIFTLIYSISFILLSFIELFSSFIDYAELFQYNYIANICLELFLGLILGVIFFPFKVPLYFYLRIHDIYNSRIINISIDKSNNNSNINILKKNILKNRFAKKQLPIVFINPFSNDKTMKNLHLGTVENIDKN